MATYRYGVVRSRIAASRLAAGAGVSGSSPLVGSLFCCDLQVKHKGQNEALDELRVSYCNRLLQRVLSKPRVATFCRGDSHVPSSTILSSAWTDRRFPGRREYPVCSHLLRQIAAGVRKPTVSTNPP